MNSVTRLFVGNLPGNVEENDIQNAFSPFGELVALDLKCKSEMENNKFAFLTLATTDANVESCINYFSNRDFNGKRLYVTRARESFLERLIRERAESAKSKSIPKTNPIIKLGDRLNPNPSKRKTQNVDMTSSNTVEKSKKKRECTSADSQARVSPKARVSLKRSSGNINSTKQSEAERKRIESLKRKTEEFKQKKMIINNSLKGVDKVQNNKIIFDDDYGEKSADSNLMSDDNDDDSNATNYLLTMNQTKHENSLFDEDSDVDYTFEIKTQFEGKNGQKVLDLQSRYKSDKRFTLDERFIEEEADESKTDDEEKVEVGHEDEKAKQLNILQDVLGVTIKTRSTETGGKQTKPKLGMLRFDPMQPDHAKFLAPVETKPEPTKKSKKKNKEKQEDVKMTQENEPDVPKVEVSKEQFYKISDTLKEAIAQPSSFSLRSLFGNNQNVDDGPQEQDTNYIPLDTLKDKRKVKNPLDPTEKNPFVYDSSDSETEEINEEVKVEAPPTIETKAVWKENLFFSESDARLREGLIFFTKAPANEVQKERRELKSLVKKRIYNKDRKNQMFKKKIGGRKKSMKKPYKTK